MSGLQFLTQPLGVTDLLGLVDPRGLIALLRASSFYPTLGMGLRLGCRRVSKNCVKWSLDEVSWN